MRLTLAIAACLAVTGCTTADEQFILNAATAAVTGYSSGVTYTPTYRSTYTPTYTSTYVNSTHSHPVRTYNTYSSGGGSDCHNGGHACAVR